jgi:poly-gamma-glutamate capsule biosynthesis protein CapA/YwtB (metallophosphatase superfamily)
VKKIFILICLLLLNAGIIFSQLLDSSRITIVFAGDIMGHIPQVSAAYDSAFGGYNYEPSFRFIKPYIDSADLAIANLEVTLGGTPYSGYPQFSSPDELAYDLKNTGFKILVMANNHCYDRGKQGFQRTLAILDSIGIPHLGTYKDSVQRSQFYPFVIEKKGIRIALLNYTYGTNGLVPEKPNIVNYISKPIIAADLAKAKSLKVDYIIAVMHWGKEYELKPNKDQIDMAKFLVKHGCNAIIGSHPHVVQTFEIIYPDTTDSLHFVPIFYSLGNLISNQRDRYRDGGAMFNITLEKKDAKTRVVDYSYLPYWVYRGVLKKKYQYYVVPTKLNTCQPDTFNLHSEDSLHIQEFDADIHQQLINLKESEFFKCR